MVNQTALDKFLKMVRTAKDYNSKEIRLSISDADALSDCLTHMLLQEREFTQKIMRLQDQIIQSQNQSVTPPGVIMLNGGKF
jgi:hypothetical protein